MRASWIPLSGCHVATIAYTLPPISKVSTAVALSRTSKPSAPSVAEPAASRVPFPWMRTSWMPPPTFGGLASRLRRPRSRSSGYPPEATAAYVVPPITNTRTSSAMRSASKPAEPWIAEPTASRVPFPWMRASRMPSSSPATPPEATAMYMAPPISNTSAPSAPWSRLKPAELSVTEPAASRVPFPWTRISKMPLSKYVPAYDQTTAMYVVPPISNASAVRAP